VARTIFPKKIALLDIVQEETRVFGWK